MYRSLRSMVPQFISRVVPGGAEAGGAAGYPNRPLHLVIPGTRGGPADTLGRMVAQRLTELWGQPFTMDNWSMNAGMKLAARSAPDGYTLVMGGGTFFINASLYRRLPFDSVRDFTPISLVGSIANVLVVHPSLPVKSLSELIAYAQAHPGALRYASIGHASPPHLAGELFRLMAGVDIGHIHYKGHLAGGKALLEGREVQLMFDAMPTAVSHIKACELRPLAVTSLKRVPALPDIPTMAECGFPGYKINPDMGILAPAGTPADIVQLLSREIGKFMQSPEVRARMQAAGMESIGSTPEQFAEYLKTAFSNWAKVVSDCHIEPQDAPPEMD